MKTNWNTVIYGFIGGFEITNAFKGDGRSIIVVIATVIGLIYTMFQTYKQYKKNE